ncbi:MAG: hypothetical protein A2Y24_02985 [Clostridiales bacterium GWE2_32_10]|nr:MAG: hypothetical protein A2Y24_02985 [Clostridiales bacterium GWE2_32_10]HBY19537.1 hypothetical protein [Clostridiales bacterium]
MENGGDGVMMKKMGKMKKILVVCVIFVIGMGMTLNYSLALDTLPVITGTSTGTYQKLNDEKSVILRLSTCTDSSTSCLPNYLSNGIEYGVTEKIPFEYLKKFIDENNSGIIFFEGEFAKITDSELASFTTVEQIRDEINSEYSGEKDAKYGILRDYIKSNSHYSAISLGNYAKEDITINQNDMAVSYKEKVFTLSEVGRDKTQLSDLAGNVIKVTFTVDDTTGAITGAVANIYAGNVSDEDKVGESITLGSDPNELIYITYSDNNTKYSIHFQDREFRSIFITGYMLMDGVTWKQDYTPEYGTNYAPTVQYSDYTTLSAVQADDSLANLELGNGYKAYLLDNEIIKVTGPNNFLEYVGYNKRYDLHVSVGINNLDNLNVYYNKGSKISDGDQSNFRELENVNDRIYGIFAVSDGTTPDDNDLEDNINSRKVNIEIHIHNTSNGEGTEGSPLETKETTSKDTLKDELIVTIPLSQLLNNYKQSTGTYTATSTDWKVDRKDVSEANTIKLNEWIQDMAMPALAFLVLIAILFIGFRAIGSATKDNPQERVKIMEGFKNILIGVFIVGFALTIVNLAYVELNNALTTITSSYTPGDIDDASVDTGSSTVWYLFSGFAKVIIAGIRGIFHWIPGFTSIEELITLKDFGDNINLSDINKYLAPFDGAGKLDAYTAGYIACAAISVPLMFIAVLKTGFSYVIHSSNYNQITQIKDDFRRFFVALVFVAVGPFVFQGILIAFNMATMLLPFQYEFSIADQFDTGNAVADIIGGLYLLYIELTIVFIFLVREVMLTVMYIITPIVIFVWAISRNAELIKVWWGELLTNAATQFIYALVFFVATIGLGKMTTDHWLLYLVWMTMVIKLAKALKNSLQGGFFKSLSGIDEEGMASPLASMTKGRYNSVKGLADEKVSGTLDKGFAKFNPTNKNTFVRGLEGVRGGYNIMKTGTNDPKKFAAGRIKAEQEKKKLDAKADAIDKINSSSHI